MPLVVLNGPIIAAGESLSDAIDCSRGELVRITMPAAWTPARLTFLLSSDGAFYNNLLDHRGAEFSMVVKPGTAVLVPANAARAVAWLKLCSGSRTNPIPQAAQREFAVAIQVAEAATA
jgi:hypothetical protein